MKAQNKSSDQAGWERRPGGRARHLDVLIERVGSAADGARPSSTGTAEHVYHILVGRGLMTLGPEARVVEARDTIFIPPGVSYPLVNNGLDNLVFIVVTSPPGELPLTDVRGPELD